MRGFISPLRLLTLTLIVLLTMAAKETGADPGIMPLFHYGIGDGKLGAPTAFAESWMRPSWVPDVVRRDWPGVAISDLPPGTAVRMTVVGLPSWADTWPELNDVIGNTVVAFVADRPGEDWYCDAWWEVFGKLAPHWVGRVDVRIEVIDLHRQEEGHESIRRGVQLSHR